MNLYIITSFIFLSCFLLVFAVLFILSKSRNPVKQRIDSIQAQNYSSELKRRKTNRSKFFFFAEGSGDSSDTELWLAKAGYRSPQSVSNYYGSRLFGVVIVGAIALILSIRFMFSPGEQILVIIAGAMVGWFLPTLWIFRKILVRREEIRRAVPNFLDLMVVCVEAGLSFTAAIHRIVDTNKGSRNPLFDELRLLNQEFLIGNSKTNAFRNLANRTGVEDIRSLALTLIQAERLGTSVADSLRVLAETMRFRRRQRAEEQANKTSVKLVFPLVLLIFPELLVILVGPALINLYNTFSNLAR